jgi:hypothetical protein
VQRADLGADPARSIPVIVVPVDDDVAACQAAQGVALGSERGALGLTNVADARVLGYELPHVVASVVQDDELDVGDVL